MVAESESDYITIPVSEIANKVPKPTNTYPEVKGTFGKQKPTIQTEASSNEVLNTEEDNPQTQAVLKMPANEQAKLVYRKDGDPNELIGVDEMTANLHANDQPVYRIVTQPSVDKKANKKSSSKEQGSDSKPLKSNHQKKSSSKGKFKT